MQVMFYMLANLVLPQIMSCSCYQQMQLKEQQTVLVNDSHPQFDVFHVLETCMTTPQIWLVAR